MGQLMAVFAKLCQIRALMGSLRAVIAQICALVYKGSLIVPKVDLQEASWLY